MAQFYENEFDDKLWEVEEITIEKNPDENLYGLSYTTLSTGTPFAVVRNIHPESAVFRNGKLRLGDVIMAVNDVNIFGVVEDVVHEAFKQKRNIVKLKVTRRLSPNSLPTLVDASQKSLWNENLEPEKRLQKSRTAAIDAQETYMLKLLDDERHTDFIIRTGNGEREIRAHRLILRASSQYFEALFGLGGVEARNGEMEVPESYEIMIQLIRFLYTGKLYKTDEEENNLEILFELLIIADKYQVYTLKDLVECTLLSLENVCDTLVQAVTRGNSEVMAKATDLIRSSRNNVWGTKGWLKLCRDHPDLVADIYFPNKASKLRQTLV